MRVFENTDELGGFLATQMAAGTAHDRFCVATAVADRSPLLHHVADSIATSSTSVFPIVVQPPRHDFDTGAVGLAQIADGISQFDQSRDLAEQIADPTIGWASKHLEVSKRLDSIGKQIVLISEDPKRWFPRFGERRLFAGRAQDVAELLSDRSPCRTIVAGGYHDRFHTEHLRLRRGDAAQGLVDGSRDWKSLTDTAAQLHSSLNSDLEGFSAIELGLLVALLHFSSIAEVRRLVDEFAPADRMAKSLVSAILRSPEFEGVIDVWGSLALARRPFEPSIVEEFVAKAFALEERVRNPTADDLIWSCLLQPVDRKVEVPAVLRSVAFELPRGPSFDAHGVFARHYADMVADGATWQLLADEMEAFHHASKAVDHAIIDRLRPFFSDQLDAWGRSLSQKRRYGSAVRVFERAIAWDPHDDYAYHYAAFNLDIVGEQPNKVEANYSKAIELDPSNVWWRTRFISFLITRGRTLEARRAWNEARRALTVHENSETSFLYEHLHIWVARLLLHRMTLDFAREVLSSIPNSVRSTMPKMIALDRHLQHLEEAERDRTVRPFSSGPTAGSQDKPERAALRDGNRGELVRWLPGRIEEIDADSIHIAVETPSEGGEKPRIRRASLPRVDFDRFSVDERSAELEEGRFIELAYYGSAEEPVVRVLRQDHSPDPDLPALGFDPDRYLRSARTGAG